MALASDMHMNKKSILHLLIGAGITGYLLAGLIPNDVKASRQESPKPPPRESKLPISARDYTFGYWQHGMRKHKGSTSKDILCIESGHYGLSLDVAELNKARFGLFKEPLDYTTALAASDSRMLKLEDANLDIELEKDGKIYRAVSCKAAQERLAENRMLSARLWESARWVQHYDFHGLEFVDDKGEKLVASATLDVVAWPESLTINAELEPIVMHGDDAQQGVRGKGRGIVHESYPVKHQPGLEHEQFTLETWVKVPKDAIHKNRGWIVSKNSNGATPGFYGIEIRGDSVAAAMNTGERGWDNNVSISTDRHTLVPDKWYHLAMTYDGKSLGIHVNGRLRNSIEVNKKRVLGSGDMRIGKRADNNGRASKIMVDQLRLWNRALSAQELIRHDRHPEKIGKPDGLTYTNDFEDGPALKLPVWQNAKIRVSLKTESKHWQAEQAVAAPWSVGEKKNITLNCQLATKRPGGEKISLVMQHNGQLPVVYRKDYDCYTASINRPKRKGGSGYTDIRDYDVIDIVVDSPSEGKLPFMMEIFGPANITGACPILCDELGRPTGIPVQLSKNWHHKGMGEYIRAYTILPAVKGQKKYKLKIAYGFYGTLPSASHAQLSLVGYGGNGRWDQLAIGCWGETYCMDVDMSCTDVAITDIRMLMARNGAKGEKWGWTDAGWGGDWLGLYTPDKKKRLFNGLKTAYLAHGPCLTEVKYDGFYGAQREVDFDATVRTLRTDDYARTFTTLHYQFDQKMSAEGWLFKMGRTGSYLTPKIAYGNADGLIQEHVVPAGLKREQAFVQRTTLSGQGPWWVAFPGAYHDREGDRGTGYRAMVIRSYKAVIGGKEYLNPTVEFPVFHVNSESKAGLDFLLTAPEGVTEFNAGDRVELDVEWITLPRVVDDHYGPNKLFIKHLTDNPSSWKTTYREAVGNDLEITLEGGRLKNRYPVIIQANKPEVTMSIKGGVGYVPVRFEGLDSASGHTLYQVVNDKEIKLDQSVHGHDFWQSDYDAKSDTFKVTYNLPLDGLGESKWILKPSPQEGAPEAKAAGEQVAKGAE